MDEDDDLLPPALSHSRVPTAAVKSLLVMPVSVGQDSVGYERYVCIH